MVATHLRDLDMRDLEVRELKREVFNPDNEDGLWDDFSDEDMYGEDEVETDTDWISEVSEDKF